MFKKLWKILLVILIIIIAFYFPAILTSALTWFTGVTGWAASGTMLAAIASSPWWVGLAAGIGLAYLIDPETTTEVIKDIATAATNTVETVVGAVAGALTGSGTALLIAGGALLFFFAKKKKDTEPMKEVVPDAIN